MSKKEFKVGEVFQYGLVKIRCEKDDIGCSCPICAFFEPYNGGVCHGMYAGDCSRRRREDHNDVIFKLLEE